LKYRLLSHPGKLIYLQKIYPQKLRDQERPTPDVQIYWAVFAVRGNDTGPVISLFSTEMTGSAQSQQ
jgi:hypothetical protein